MKCSLKMDYILRNRKKGDILTNNSNNKRKDVYDKSDEKSSNERVAREKLTAESDEPDTRKNYRKLNGQQVHEALLKKEIDNINCSLVNEIRRDQNQGFVVNIEFDLISILLFTFAFVTRIYKLSEPKNIV